MQTRNKASGRNSREVASPRVSRQQKKLVENEQVQAKKATELITSSVRKKKVALPSCSPLDGISDPQWLRERLFPSATQVIEEPVAGTNLDTKFSLVDFVDSDVCLGYDAQHKFDNSFVIEKSQENGITDCDTDTIFSPPFHNARNIGGEVSSGDFYRLFQQNCQQFDYSLEENIPVDCHGGGGLSPEVSAIYLSVKDSNLECVNENNRDHMSEDVCQEEVDDEEYDDFDPYFFIKNLPDLSSVVPTFRPVLLPKQTRSCPSTSLVLDLDETLVHSSLEPCDDADFTFSVNFNSMEHPVYVRCRPHLREFLERVSKLFEIIIFTASQSIYAERVLNVLDPKRKIFRHRIYRDSCVMVDENYLKDLSVLGRDLERVIIIDNSPQVFGFQVDNGIPIESWYDDRSDTELLSLLPFLESLVGVEDVRPIIAKKFNLREKIAAAACPIIYNQEGLI